MTKKLELYELLQKIKEGESDAFAQFYDLTIELVYGFCLRILSNQKIAEETVEEVYIYLWNNASDINPERESLVIWFLEVTRNHAISKLKELRSAQNSESNLENNESEDQTSENIYNLNKSRKVIKKKIRINKALSRLSNIQRNVLELAYYKGMSQSQIAQAINIPIGSVKDSLRLAVQNTRIELNNFEDNIAIAR